VIASVILSSAFVTFIVFEFSGSKPSDPEPAPIDHGTNPMVEIFNSEPDYTHYTFDQSFFDKKFWKVADYGGSILDPIILKDRTIPNNMKSDL
jgi:hypothetical protein